MFPEDFCPGFCWVVEMKGKKSSVWKLKPWWQMVWLKPEENCSSDPKEEVMMFTMVWHRGDRHVLNKSVAKGSREQVEAFCLCRYQELLMKDLVTCESKIVLLSCFRESNLCKSSHGLCRLSGGWCARSFVEPLQLASRGPHWVMLVDQGVGQVKETEWVLRGPRETRLNTGKELTADQRWQVHRPTDPVVIPDTIPVGNYTRIDHKDQSIN